jgi:hypothetical protein
VFQDVVSKELLTDFQKPKAIPEELGQEEKGQQLTTMITFLLPYDPEKQGHYCI